MPWFAAHVVIYFKWKHEPQTRFTVWENVHILEAADAAEAWVRAEALGQREEGDDRGTLREVDEAGEHPMKRVFAGVRKVLTVAHESETEQLGTDDEVTFSEFIVEGEEAVRQLAAGKSVSLTYTAL